MKKIAQKIESLKSEIQFQKDFINRLSGKQGNEELIDHQKMKITDLERKLQILEEQQKNGGYISKKPELGDDRYQKFIFKNEIDTLRVLYYDYFHKDPSLYPTADDVMFGDPTLPIYTSSFLIKGEIPFKLMLTEKYPNYQPNEKYSVGINFDKNNLSKEISREYLQFISELIKKYSNNDINFICCDGFNKGHNFNNCTLAYIGENGFFKTYASNLRMYYEFFDRLCDNNLRNIVYIGDTMKENAPLDEIDKVETKFIAPHTEYIAEILGVSIEELVKTNKELCSRVLTHKK